MFPPETRVLLVEDVVTLRKMIADILRQLGLRDVGEADDGADAWAEIKAARKAGNPYRLIISDWQMPYMRGIDLLKKIRATPAEAETIFIMLTSVTDKEAIVDAARTGVADYIMKPVKFETFSEKLKAVYVKTEFANHIVIE